MALSHLNEKPSLGCFQPKSEEKKMKKSRPRVREGISLTTQTSSGEGGFAVWPRDHKTTISAATQNNIHIEFA